MHTFAATPVAQSRQLDTRNGQALPSPLAGQFELATGRDLSQVRIHTASPSRQAAQNLNARAFAFGQDIHFGAGEFDPSSRQGMHLIAHEVAHTLQQRMSRRDAPVVHTPARASAAAEQEADAFADAFMRGGTHRLSEQTGAPVIAAAPKGKQAPEPDLPGTRRVALNTSLNDLAIQFGPVVVAGRKVDLSLRLALKGNVKGVLPEAAKPEKGQKRPTDPGPASALATLREAISQAQPVISGPVMTLDLAGAMLKVGVTQAGKTVQQILSVHATNKLTLHAAGLEFVGSGNAHLVTTVSPVANADASAVADGDDVLSELSFLGQAAQLKDVVEGTGRNAKITKAHNIASSDPAMVSKLLAVKAVLNLADDALRNEIRAEVHANAVAANEKKPAKKQLDKDALTAKADADARKAVGKTQFASTQFGEAVDNNEEALRLLEFMRPWFGSDEKTIAHFQKMRRVKGQNNLLAHDSLARRLEAVQDTMSKRYPELGQNAYPQTTVGWAFRGELQLGARQGHANMHKIGQAIDFDAYNLPMIKTGETRALIQAVTGRSNALFQPGPHGEKGFTDYGHRRATVRAIESDPAAAKNREAFLASLSASIDATAKASYDFRHSLDTPPVPGGGSVNAATNATNAANAGNAAGTGQPAAVQNDDPSSGWAKFDALRNEWADAIEMPDSEDETEKKAKEDKLAKVQQQIVSLIQPWLTKIEAHQQQMIKEAQEKNNVDITAPGPQVKPLQDAEKPLKALAARLARKPATVFNEKEQKQIANAASLIGFELPDPVTAATLAELAEQLSSKRISEEKRAKERKVVADQDAAYWWDGQLIEKLKNDRAFLFGKLGHDKEKNRTWGESVDEPGAGQILRRGWFRVAEPGATRSTPSKEFMLEMAQHGFEMGAAWGSSDSMHYEVAV